MAKPQCEHVSAPDLHPTYANRPCPRIAGWLFVNRQTEQRTYRCGLHSTRKRGFARFKLDDDGRPILLPPTGGRDDVG